MMAVRLCFSPLRVVVGFGALFLCCVSGYVPPLRIVYQLMKKKALWFKKKKKKKNLKANFLSNTQHGTTLNAHSRLYIKMMHDDDHFESSKNLVCNQLAKDVSLPQKLYPTSK
jgi:hypothetical protein